MIQSFSRRILIYSKDVNDLTVLFSSRSAYNGDSFYMEEEVIPFIPAGEEEFKEGKCELKPLLKRFPEEFELYGSEEGILLGYDCRSREEVFHSGPLTIASYDERTRSFYEKAYGDKENIRIIDPCDLKKMPEALLFIGEGAFSQRVFSVYMKEDLKKEEGLYFVKGRRKKLRCGHA